MTPDPALLDDLAGRLSGRLLRPGDDAYDAARRVHNGLVDRSPAVIIRCRSAADVAAGVRFARAAGLDISVRGGGHNVAGRAVADGAVMIDLAEMKGIEVDVAARTVRAEGGLSWAELNEATAADGLAVTGGAISTTGIAGLTLGGGLGWLMAKYGLAADNLLAVELVNAEGEVLDVTDSSDPELFWALGGGGGNFGIATTFTYRLQPVGMVTGGLIAHPIEAGPAMLRFYRDAVAGCSDDLTVFAGLVHAPDGSGMKLAAMVVFHTGDPAQAERDLAPFTTWGSPLVVQVGPMPYPVMNTLLDAGYPAGALNYWLSSFARGLTDGLIDTMAERFATVPSPMTVMLLEHFHGAVTRIPRERDRRPASRGGLEPRHPIRLDGSGSHRGEHRLDARDPPRALRPHLGEGRWLNYLGDDQESDAVKAAYGPNYDRLLAAKRRYDPENVFHHNHNINPA